MAGGCMEAGKGKAGYCGKGWASVVGLQRKHRCPVQTEFQINSKSIFGISMSQVLPVFLLAKSSNPILSF